MLDGNHKICNQCFSPSSGHSVHVSITSNHCKAHERRDLNPYWESENILFVVIWLTMWSQIIFSIILHGMQVNLIGRLFEVSSLQPFLNEALTWAVFQSSPITPSTCDCWKMSVKVATMVFLVSFRTLGYSRSGQEDLKGFRFSRILKTCCSSVLKSPTLCPLLLSFIFGKFSVVCCTKAL